jgi:hypothetical protein
MLSVLYIYIYIYDTPVDGLMKPKHVVKERVQYIHVKFSCE